MLLVVMILATAMMSPLAAFGAVVTLAVLYQILDCTDGTLARAKGLSSIQGQYWDLVADVIYRGIAYTAVGYVCDQLSPWPGALSQATILALSAWLAVVARLARLNIERLTPPSAPAAQGPRFTAFSFLSGLDTVFPLLAVLAWATNSLNGFVLWIFIYSLGDVVSALQEARGKLHP
ncbi:MAG: hypothetical protein JNM45_10545 [Rhizobiales bacterium]|nr:hypothetical protein [Hyphomicrobiales bacterium]